MVAPPWISVPPPGYGGIGAVLGPLGAARVERAHAFTLFAARGSSSPARVEPILPRTYPNNIERALFEVDYVARIFARIEELGRTGSPFHVIHDHCGFTAVAMADRIQIPIV